MKRFSIVRRPRGMTAAEARKGRYMRAPDGHEYDITSDLMDGSDGALGDPSPNGAAADAVPAVQNDAQSINQRGAQPVHENKQQDAAKPTSLRDQLSSAFKGIDDKPTQQKDAANAGQSQQTLTLTQDASGKYRLPDGTFASEQQVQAFQAAQNSAQQPQQGQQPAQQQPQYNELIGRLTPAEQQQFQSLPAELQQFVGRTMEDLNTRAGRYGEYDQIEQHILGPRREAFAREGTNPVVALNQLFALSDFAGSDPSNFVMWFADQHKLDLDALLDARDAAASGDPQIQQLQGTVQTLQQQLHAREQQELQQQQQRNVDLVRSFAEAVGPDNKPLRPHMPDVMNEWGTQIAAIRQANPNMPPEEVLQKAYDNACWSNPAVRAKMQEAASAQQVQANAARVEQARAAGSSVTGAPLTDPSTVPNNTARSLREELDHQFAIARA